MPDRTVNAMLKDKFEAKHAGAAVRHFTRLVQDFQQREWEDANAKAGRFAGRILVLKTHKFGVNAERLTN